MNPADIYEERFVPALFGLWGERIAAVADIAPGQRCLDVACGTGALTRAVVARAGDPSLVVGLDAQPEMLDVARRAVPGVRWVEGDATALSFEDGSFDRSVSQFGLMFVDDPGRALAELRRVTRPGGRVVAATCAAVERSPAYAVLTEVLHRLFGPTIAESFRAPFALGTEAQWQAIANDVSIPADVVQLDGEVRFPSIEALIEAERACAWTLGGLLDDDQFVALVKAAEPALRPFLKDGMLRFSMPAIVVTVTP
ncbi:MAG: methyltransferase domain-containing protein [Myxococcota bacterium]